MNEPPPWNPMDEPTTLDHHDLPSPTNGIPHRHKDTDLRPSFGVLVWCGVMLLVVAATVLLWAYFRKGGA